MDALVAMLGSADQHHGGHGAPLRDAPIACPESYAIALTNAYTRLGANVMKRFPAPSSQGKT
jgi:hypothetical protein